MKKILALILAFTLLPVILPPANAAKKVVQTKKPAVVSRFVFRVVEGDGAAVVFTTSIGTPAAKALNPAIAELIVQGGSPVADASIVCEYVLASGQILTKNPQPLVTCRAGMAWLAIKPYPGFKIKGWQNQFQGIKVVVSAPGYLDLTIPLLIKSGDKEISAALIALKREMDL